MTRRPILPIRCLAFAPALALAACADAPAASPPAAAPPVTTTATIAPPAVAPVATPEPPRAVEPPAPARWVVRDVPLPGATAPASLDYIAYEAPTATAAGGRVWVPVGVTGSVDVYDVASGAFKRVDGFKTGEREAHGKKRVVGPSAVAIGDGYAYIGDRASSEVCAIDRATLARGACTKVPKGIDGVAYVASSKEVWVTTPDDESMTILATSAGGHTKAVAAVKVGGSPEGYAVDEGRGLFFTNLEDKGKTVVIDVAKRAIVSTWTLGCGGDGPRGLAVDAARQLALVACTDHVEVRDAAHDGALLGKVDTGAGVDNVDYVAATRRLYVAAGKASRLTVVEVGDGGTLTVVATADTHDGARNGVADASGRAYLADSPGARLVVVSAP